MNDFQRPSAGAVGVPSHALFASKAARAMAVVFVVVALTGAGLYIKGRSALELVPISSQRQLTSGHALETEPAISPDGKTVAFASNDSGNLDIWAVDVRGGPPQRLTSNPASDHHPSWFPDGAALAFASDRNGRTSIWRAPRLDGDAATLLIADADSPAVSPDGSEIAFVRLIDGAFMQVAIAPLREPSRMRLLTSDRDGLWDHNDPAWSPDGRTICYTAGNRVWRVSAAGGTPSALTTDAQVAAEPAWSADGRFVYFTAYESGRPALWRTPASGGIAQPVTVGSGSEHMPNISRDGRLVAFSTSLGTSDLVLRDLVTGRETEFGSSRDEMFPVFAPDGLTVYFVSNRWGHYEIWSQALAGERPTGAARRVAEQDGVQSQPDCSPDGKWLAYYRILNNRRHVFVVSASGGTPVQFTDNETEAMYPAWSADGAQLAFVSTRDGTHQIWRQPIAGGRPAGAAVRVTSDPAPKRWPVWSPDGSQIAYTSSTDEIVIVDIASRQPPRTITNGASALRVRWSRRSQVLMIPGRWGAREYVLRRLTPEGAPALPTSPPMVLGVDPQVGLFNVSADERYLITARGNQVGNIWVIETDLSRF